MPRGDTLSDRLAASLAAFRSGRGGEGEGDEGGGPRPSLSRSSGETADDAGAAACDRVHEYEERAAILEYDQGLSRADAERIARAGIGAPPGSM